MNENKIVCVLYIFMLESFKFKAHRVYSWRILKGQVYNAAYYERFRCDVFVKVRVLEGRLYRVRVSNMLYFSRCRIFQVQRPFNKWYFQCQHHHSLASYSYFKKNLLYKVSIQLLNLYRWIVKNRCGHKNFG